MSRQPNDLRDRYSLHVSGGTKGNHSVRITDPDAETYIATTLADYGFSWEDAIEVAAWAINQVFYGESDPDGAEFTFPDNNTNIAIRRD